MSVNQSINNREYQHILLLNTTEDPRPGQVDVSEASVLRKKTVNNSSKRATRHIYTCGPRTLEAEAGGWQVQVQHQLQSKIPWCGFNVKCPQRFLHFDTWSTVGGIVSGGCGAFRRWSLRRGSELWGGGLTLRTLSNAPLPVCSMFPDCGSDVNSCLTLLSPCLPSLLYCPVLL